MTRLLRQIVRLATLLIGISATSVALAVATVEVTTTGVIRDSTTLQLDNIVGDHRYVFDKNKTSINMPAGTYTARVLYMGLPSGEPHTVTVTDGVINRLEYDGSGNVKELPPVELPPVASSSPFGFMQGVRPSSGTISAVVGTVKAKSPTNGVFPDSDKRLQDGISNVTTYGVDANIELLKEMRIPAFYGGCLWTIGGSVSDPSNSIQVPAGTKTGWAYWMPAPNGSTGISSSGGADAHVRTRFSEGHLNWSVPRLLKEQAPWSVLGRPMLGFQHFEFKYNASISNLTVPGVSSTTDQKLKEDDFSAGYGVWAEYMFPNRAWAGAGAGLNAIYYHARYNGTQDNLCAVCAAPTDHFTVGTSDSKSGVSWGASVNAIVGFPVAQNAEIFLLGTYDHRDKSGVVTSKVTPSDDAPHLRTASREFASAQLGVRVKF